LNIFIFVYSDASRLTFQTGKSRAKFQFQFQNDVIQNSYLTSIVMVVAVVVDARERNTQRGELNIQAKSSKSMSGSRLMKGSNSISGRGARGMTSTKKADGSANNGPDYTKLEISEEVSFWSTVRQARAIKEGVFRSRELLELIFLAFLPLVRELRCA
jgi:hypothetical protein